MEDQYKNAKWIQENRDKCLEYFNIYYDLFSANKEDIDTRIQNEIFKQHSIKEYVSEKHNYKIFYGKYNEDREEKYIQQDIREFIELPNKRVGLTDFTDVEDSNDEYSCNVFYNSDKPKKRMQISIEDSITLENTRKDLSNWKKNKEPLLDLL